MESPESDREFHNWLRGMVAPAGSFLDNEPLDAVCFCEPLYASPDMTLGSALALLRATHRDCLLIGTPTKLQGIVTQDDILFRTTLESIDATEQTLAELMTADPETVTIGAEIAHALRKMFVGEYRHLPITDLHGHQVVGVVGLRDIVNYLVELHGDEILNVPPESNHRPYPLDGG